MMIHQVMIRSGVGGGMNLLMMLTVITTVALLMIRMATEELV